jgi:hypothetical protein
MRIGLEAGVALRPDVMQREDGAEPGEDRPQPQMCTAEIKRIETGADKCLAKALHLEMAARLGCRRLPGNR